MSSSSRAAARRSPEGQVAERQRDVLQRVEVREQRVVLEYQADRALLGADPDVALGIQPSLAVTDHAALSGPKQSCDRAQDGRFAAARWPHQGKQLARSAAQVDVEDDRCVVPQSHRKSCALCLMDLRHGDAAASRWRRPSRWPRTRAPPTQPTWSRHSVRRRPAPGRKWRSRSFASHRGCCRRA